MPRFNRNNSKEEIESRLIDLRRVTRVTKGGKQLSFRACIVMGDRKGKIGEGTEKGADVAIAIEKATRNAKKELIKISLDDLETIPYQIKEKYCAAEILLKPAPKGTGVKAGGSIRIVLELAGIKNVVSKMLGSRNKISNVRATINALKKISLLKKEKKSDKNKKQDEKIKN
ncbi:MAG: 30S ribosomal protein S5, chloroplastic-like [Parcubacteria group bacterium Athens1014_10]|nr:MAG: 30S ribosomal protein S5, chloroplastic-like [Parcubacteria group bacterium Athens1014_10]TSD05482.1 MAG: 30S ribosomal protein S5, chloroplastic-like [Parcubacteria group bacterium Athens0714_12]